MAGSTTTVYKYYYDWLDRLLRVEKGPNTSSLSPVSIYTYDESDNPTKLELPEAFLEYDFTFDLASNIETRKETDTTVSSAPVVNFTENFTPDEDGNVLTRTRTVGADTHQVTYEWDDFNKLVSVSASLNGSPAAEPKQSNAYAVNGFRRQKTKKDGEILTEYAEGLATAVAKAQAETITYIHGHQILGFEQGGQFYYFLTDALGSVRDIVDGTGQVVQQYQYDERGNHVIAPMSGGPASPKTFVGGLSVNDDTSDGGLYLMGHRFYDPSLGRFLNRDPIGFAGGLNLFSYGANNPVTYTDHTGLEPIADPNPLEELIRQYEAQQVNVGEEGSFGERRINMSRLLSRNVFVSTLFIGGDDHRIRPQEQPSRTNPRPPSGKPPCWGDDDDDYLFWKGKLRRAVTPKFRNALAGPDVQLTLLEFQELLIQEPSRYISTDKTSGYNVYRINEPGGRELQFVFDPKPHRGLYGTFPGSFVTVYRTGRRR